MLERLVVYVAKMAPVMKLVDMAFATKKPPHTKNRGRVLGHSGRRVVKPKVW